MSGRYTVGASSAFKAVNTAYFGLRNTGTTERLYVVEIGISVATAVTGALASLYVSRSSAVGTSSTTLAGQANDPGETASVGTLDSAWSVQPTFSTTNWLRSGGMAVAAGSMLVWTFYDAPLIVPASTSQGLIIACSTAQTAGSLAAYFTWDE